MKRNFFIFILFFLITIGVYFGINFYKTIIFFKQKERVNFVIYSPYFLGYSFDLKGNLNYILFFDLDKKVYVPGGYGYYYLGGIGKLAYLEKKTEILKNTFSYLYLVPFDGVFYKNIKNVYEGKVTLDKKFPTFLDILSYKSDFNLYERIYLAFKMLDISKFNYKNLDIRRAYENEFVNSSKVKNIVQGKFYSEIFRREDKVVDLYSNSYVVGNNLKLVLEGVGIKIFDIKKNKVSKLNCLVEELAEKQSVTAKFLVNYFNCDYKNLNIDDGLVDIKFFLNNLEEQWK